ncbi:MAG: hypothetical protein QM773_03150 [Hyphomonadaceae bacterium]
MKRMLAAAFVGLTLAPAALAQQGLSTKPDYDLIDKADRIDEATQKDINKLHNDAVTALQAKDYATAELRLEELFKRGGAPADSNFLMGLAKIGLEQWGEAQPFLEKAVAYEPSRPEPRTRLGLALVMLEQPDKARAQREALLQLDIACNKTCADQTWITDGIRTLDQALAAKSPSIQSAKLAASAAAVAPTTPPKDFDPTKYNITVFTDTHDLYDLLTQSGRCPEKQTAEPRQPCALILYRPVDAEGGGLAANFKPVFKVVNRSTVWAIHDKKLQKVKIEDLYYDSDDVIGQKRVKYTSVALVGNAENKANCDAQKQCLANLVSDDMFRMYGNMPDSVVEVVWGAGMKDVGTVRVR